MDYVDTVKKLSTITCTFLFTVIVIRVTGKSYSLFGETIGNFYSQTDIDTFKEILDLQDRTQLLPKANPFMTVLITGSSSELNLYTTSTSVDDLILPAKYIVISYIVNCYYIFLFQIIGTSCTF